MKRVLKNRCAKKEAFSRFPVEGLQRLETPMKNKTEQARKRRKFRPLGVFYRLTRSLYSHLMHSLI